jgi:hypothetical protein
VGCAKEVSNLINRPVVSLLGTRLGGTSAEVVPQWINLKLLSTTSRERHFRKERGLGSRGGGEKGLRENSRPGLILKYKTRLGASSSCDSKFSISVRNTESSTVATDAFVCCGKNKFHIKKT